jgi:Dna[CI] antecedent DciA-like protein
MNTRRRPMRRVGDLLPTAAASLGLEEELRFARAMAGWQRLVAELAPAAAGRSRLIAVRPAELVVSASEGIVAQELRLRSGELLAAFANVPGGARVPDLRVVIRPGGAPDWRDGRGPGTREKPRVD